MADIEAAAASDAPDEVSEQVGAPPSSSAGGGPAAATTTYDLLRTRLAEVAGRLRDSADRLNADRVATFATSKTVLAEQDRLHTDGAATPRDCVSVGGLLLFGYNPAPGLSSRRGVPDVLSLLRVEQRSEKDWDFTPLSPGDPAWFLDDSSFQRDFAEIYTYYADARLLALRVREGELLMVFGIGSSHDDVRVLRWRLSATAPPMYIDAHGERDVEVADRYDFVWHEAGRDRIVDGRWSHYDLADMLHVGLSGGAGARASQRGTLEFRIDDVIVGGRTIHSERVAEPEQELSEIRIATARLGELLLVRMLPYREQEERFYIYNRFTRALHRTDAMARGCRQLPENQGVVFPGGFHLQNGETRIFATDSTSFDLYASHHSPNGEDILYVYHRSSAGDYLLLTYNMVARTMDVPIECHGYALFPDGVIACVRAAHEPQRVHTVSVYSTPFCVPEQYQPPVPSASFFGRIGNPELVRALGECLSLARDASKTEFNSSVFEALVARATRQLDAHAWLSEPEANGLGPILVELRRAAGSVLDEFAAVASAKREAASAVTEAEREVLDFVASAELEIRDADAYIDLMARARVLLGRTTQLGDMRHIDRDAVAALTTRLQSAYEGLGSRAIEFLDSESALDGVRGSVDASETEGNAAATSTAVLDRARAVDAVGDRLVMLTEVVGGLDVEDITRKTSVLARLSDLMARRNGVRAALDARAATLRSSEAAAGFAASLAVLSQRTTAAVMSAADSAACDASLATISAEIENIELAYGDVAEFADAISTKREELYEAFTRRREALGAQRTARIDRLVASAERVLQTIVARGSQLADREDIDGFFATDPLVVKVRRTRDELVALGEAGRANELDIALESARDTARRAATDRGELFEAGSVKIGRWKFGVNTEPFEVRLASAATLVRITGTDLVLPIGTTALAGFEDLAEQSYPSETATMSRALYLAFEAHRLGLRAEELRATVSTRIEDGFDPGIHDADAALILLAVSPVLSTDGLWCDGSTRAVAGIWLGRLGAREREDALRALAAVRALGHGRARHAFVRAHGDALRTIATEAGLHVDIELATDLLVSHGADIRVTQTAADRAREFDAWARVQGLDVRRAGFAELVRWLADRSPEDGTGVAAEAAWMLDQPSVGVASDVPSHVVVTGLRSTHPTIESGGRLPIDVGAAYSAYLAYRRDGLARFDTFAKARRTELDKWRKRLAIDALHPKVLSSFVRNRLLDELYLPLIGDGVARQLGMSGSAGQGLLLLISPPGYGKTTLVEYVTNLLGFAMVKINGPALGADVKSLDPGAAPDAASAEELAKLNRAFAMGNNVVCYLDDIQHTSPELLQKFIPLCDATRRVEGVIDGEPRAFDLTGKRFVMVMAGNPYTSAGATFRIPDMLANRADVHNLGDVAQEAAAAFAQSYIENACGVNEVMAPVLSRGRQDLEVLLRSVMTDVPLRSDHLSVAYGATDLKAIMSTLSHLCRVRDALLKVNDAYIHSATLDDQMRGEPRFLLQGSYRNMARIAQRILPAMTTAEVDAIVADHYHDESQTLAASAAWNLAKLGEVLGTATESDRARLGELRDRWKESNVGADPLSVIASALKGIEQALRRPG